MDIGQDKPRPRVVILSCDALAGAQELQDLREHVDTVRVPSAYETLAEILVKPTIALVVDLRMLGHRHLKLVQHAMSRGLEVFAIGALHSGLTIEDLSGVRLMSRAQLPDAIKSLVCERGKAKVETPPTPEPVPVVPEVAEMEDKPTVKPVAAHVKPTRQRVKKVDNRYASSNSRNLLTPEELSALLEDE